MSKKNQKGILIHGIIIAVVIVAGIGSIAVYVWHGTRDSESANSGDTYSMVSSSSPATVSTFTECKQTDGSRIQQSSPQVCTTKDGKKFVQPMAVKRYISILEWGVRIPYSGSDTFTYKMSKIPEKVNIISKELADKYDCTDSGAGVIYRRKPSDAPGFNYLSSEMAPTVEQDAVAHPTRYVRLGSYYYAYTKDSVVCSSKITNYPSGLQASAVDIPNVIDSSMLKIESITN